jgi:hypothetical protein
VNVREKPFSRQPSVLIPDRPAVRIGCEQPIALHKLEAFENTPSARAGVGDLEMAEDVEKPTLPNWRRAFREAPFGNR